MEPQHSPNQTVIHIIAGSIAVLAVLYFFSNSFTPLPSPFSQSLSKGELAYNPEVSNNTSSKNNSNPGEERYYLYFNRDGSSGSVCSSLYPVTRVGYLDGVGKEAAAVFQLMDGPSKAEADSGFQSFISENTMSTVESVSLKGETAYVNFSSVSTKVPAARFNCVRKAIHTAVDKTLKQFGTVSAVHYSMNGSEEIFQDWVNRGE